MAGTQTQNEALVAFRVGTLIASGAGDINSLEAGFQANSLQNGARAYVVDVDAEYQWFDTSVAAAAPPDVILPLGQNPATPGRWLRIYSGGVFPSPTGNASEILRINDAGDGFAAGPATLADDGIIREVEAVRFPGTMVAERGRIRIPYPSGSDSLDSALVWSIADAGQLSSLRPQYLVAGATSFAEDQTGLAFACRAAAGGAKFLGWLVNPTGTDPVLDSTLSWRIGFATRNFVSPGQTLIGGGSSHRGTLSANFTAGWATWRGGDIEVEGGAFQAAGGLGVLRGGQVFGAGAAGATGLGGHAWVAGGNSTLAAGTNVLGNVSVGSANPTAFNFQSMEAGIHIQDATTIPSGDPASGVFYYVNPATNLIEWRQPAASLPVLTDLASVISALVSYGLATT